MPTILTVSQLTQQIKDLVEANFPYAWVAGEVTDFRGPAASGHLYFALKDETAQIRAVIWRSQATRLRFELQNGLEVVAAGPVEVYAARGTYQIIIEQLVPQGVGALELAFRQLQQKLAAEGLFDPQRKRPLPRFPRRIALITSPGGAAVRDILQVLARRWPAAEVLLLPVRVQGEAAAQEIAAAFQTVERLEGIDLVITGRGGGSLEDLWAFNEEIVARAVAACSIPVVCGVGHEIDVSIADLVADRRALTPSEAAELAVPQRSEILTELGRLRQRLAAALQDRARRARLQLDSLATRRLFLRPLERIHDRTGRIDELAERLRRAVRVRLERETGSVERLRAALDALSPLNVLQRGYSITRKLPGGEVLRDAANAAPGDQIESLLSTGRLVSRVETADDQRR